MNVLNNLKIGSRLTLIFALIITITSSGLIYISLRTKNIKKEVDLIYNVHLLSMEYLIEADRDAYQSSLALSHSLTQRSLEKKSDIEKNLGFVNENFLQVDQRFSKFEELSDVTKQNQNIRTTDLFHTSYSRWGKLSDEIIYLLNAGQTESAISLYFREYQEVFEEMRGTMDYFTTQSLESAQKAHDNSMRIARLILINSIILTFLIIIVITTLGILLTRSINRPINDSVNYITEISNGNLDLNLSKENLDRKDEIGILTKALQNMSEKLKEIVESILIGSENIASASQQMSKTSQMVSQSAYGQAASVEEISSSMEEMVSNIMQNADHSNQAEQIVNKAVLAINEGSHATVESVNSMRTIAEKVKVINDIAFQTNILALNAAVEAARAGEHGRGFAVVAVEVRKLAENSRVAAVEIDRLTVNGVKVAEIAGKRLTDIVPEIEKTAQLVQEIAMASQEQNSGADQVNNAIQQLNLGTQQNASTSEEMATSSEELAGQAEHLKDMISFFKIKSSQQKSYR